MNDDVMMRERLSALADGELQGDEFAGAMVYASTQQGQADWHVYHLIGDVMRGTEVAHATHVGTRAAHAADHAATVDMLGRLRDQLALEPGPHQAVPAPLVAGATGTPREDRAAANASVFRWKLAAGFASLAAVAAFGWNVFADLGAADQAGAQLAAAQPAGTVPIATSTEAPTATSTAPSTAPSTPPAPAAALLAAAGGANDEPQVMLRDQRLDELLAAHKQFGSTSALQMPAGFLRNATFEAPAR